MSIHYLVVLVPYDGRYWGRSLYRSTNRDKVTKIKWNYQPELVSFFKNWVEGELRRREIRKIRDYRDAGTQRQQRN